MAFIPNWTPEVGDRVRIKEDVITPEGKFTAPHDFKIYSIQFGGVLLVEDLDGHKATVVKGEVTRITVRGLP